MTWTRETAGSISATSMGDVAAVIDRGCVWAMLAGHSHGCLLIMARNPTLPDETLEPLLDQAKDAGFDLTGLMWVKQGRARISER